MNMRTRILEARRLVVKIGSALITNNGAGLNHAALDDWARQITLLRQEGREIALVSSGAIAEGMQRLGWKKRPSEMHSLQAAAAIGQMGLVEAYEKNFSRHGLATAQILLTHDDLSDRQRYLNARSTLIALLELGAIPIINENDTVVTDEIKFGDNDTLGALVANLIEADGLIILTDQKGLHTADPRRDPNAELIEEGSAEDPRFEGMAGGAASSLSKGGMLTKVLAAQRAARGGTHTCIASGHEPDILLRLARGERVGTLLHASNSRLAARKQWLANHLQLAGTLVIDAGAAKALHEGRSLLPVGILEVKGDFRRGEAVACVNEAGEEIARGLANYGASECRRILRKPSADIEFILGYVDTPEVIHRDNLVTRAAR